MALTSRLYSVSLSLSKTVKSSISHARYFNNVSSKSGPLNGIRIIDITRILAGTQLLGDMGAEIIKVENPIGGDDTRTWGPPFKNGESAYFLGLNRNKKSIAIDLQTKEGQKIVQDLILNADVFVENFVPGKLAHYNLDYDTLSKINPKLIYASITGYGATGPYASKTGYDVIVSAEGGFMSFTGSPDTDEPVKAGVAVTDIATGLYVHGAVLAALFSRVKSGVGQKIDSSLLETQICTLASVGSSYLIGGVEPKKWGTAHSSIVPYQAFRTEDVNSKSEYIIIGVGNDKQFVKFCELIGKDWYLDPKFATNAQRVRNRTEIIPLVSEVLATRTLKSWLDLFQNGEYFPCAPINRLPEVYNHPQALHREMVQTVKHPVAGDIKLAGHAVKYSETPMSIRLAPPLLGQHTDEILKDVLKYDSKIIDNLREKKIIL